MENNIPVYSYDIINNQQQDQTQNYQEQEVSKEILISSEIKQEEEEECQQKENDSQEKKQEIFIVPIKTIKKIQSQDDQFQSGFQQQKLTDKQKKRKKRNRQKNQFNDTTQNDSQNQNPQETADSFLTTEKEDEQIKNQIQNLKDEEYTTDKIQYQKDEEQTVFDQKQKYIHDIEDNDAADLSINTDSNNINDQVQKQIEIQQKNKKQQQQFQYENEQQQNYNEEQLQLNINEEQLQQNNIGQQQPNYNELQNQFQQNQLNKYQILKQFEEFQRQQYQNFTYYLQACPNDQIPQNFLFLQQQYFQQNSQILPPQVNPYFDLQFSNSQIINSNLQEENRFNFDQNDFLQNSEQQSNEILISNTQPQQSLFLKKQQKQQQKENEKKYYQQQQQSIQQSDYLQQYEKNSNLNQNLQLQVTVKQELDINNVQQIKNTNEVQDNKQKNNMFSKQKRKYYQCQRQFDFEKIIGESLLYKKKKLINEYRSQQDLQFNDIDTKNAPKSLIMSYFIGNLDRFILTQPQEFNKYYQNYESYLKYIQFWRDIYNGKQVQSINKDQKKQRTGLFHIQTLFTTFKELDDNNAVLQFNSGKLNHIKEQRERRKSGIENYKKQEERDTLEYQFEQLINIILTFNNEIANIINDENKDILTEIMNSEQLLEVFNEDILKAQNFNISNRLYLKKLLRQEYPQFLFNSNKIPRKQDYNYYSLLVQMYKLQQPGQFTHFK